MSLYQFMDFQATDFTTKYPDLYPGVGSVWFISWRDFEPSPGVYNYTKIDAWLNAEAQNKLKDGSKKPLIAFLFVHGAPKGDNGVDYTPDWLKQTCPTITLNAGGRLAAMPAYGNLTWWSHLKKASQAFAAYLNGKVDYIDIGHGCDGELQAHKDPWNQLLPGGVESLFTQQTLLILPLYKQAAPDTQILVRATPGPRKTIVRAAIPLGIGFHFCGAQRGNQNIFGWGREYGPGDAIRETKAKGLPVLAETTSGLGTEADGNWMLLAMAAAKVNGYDPHPDWLTKIKPEMWNWALEHAGKGPQESPSAWCVLRDYNPKWPPVQWTSRVDGMVCGQSDWMGNFDFYLEMEDGYEADRVLNVGPADDYRSEQCRLVKDAIFYVDENFHVYPYNVKVTWLQKTGHILTLEYTNRQDEVVATTVASKGTEVWDTTDFYVDDRSFNLVGDALVHRIDVTPCEPKVTTNLNLVKASLQVAKDDLALSNASVLKLQDQVISFQARLVDMASTMEILLADLEDAKAAQASAVTALNQATEELQKVEAEIA